MKARVSVLPRTFKQEHPITIYKYMSTLHCVVQVTPRFISKLRNQPCERHALYGLASQAVRPNVTVEVYIQTSLLPCLSKSRYRLIWGTYRHSQCIWWFYHVYVYCMYSLHRSSSHPQSPSWHVKTFHKDKKVHSHKDKKEQSHKPTM